MRGGRIVLVLALAAVSACGSDEAASPPSTTLPVEITVAPAGTLDEPIDDTGTTSSPTTGPAPTTVATDGPLGSDAAGDDTALLCAVYEDLFAVGFAVAFVAVDDPELPDLLLLAAMPALAQRWEAAVGRFPIDGVSPGFEDSTRQASAVLGDAAAAVRASGADQQAIDAFGAALLSGDDVVEPPPADGFREFLDDELLAELAAVGFDFDAAFDGVPEPAESELGAVCPYFGVYLDAGGPSGPVGEACGVVDTATLTIVFDESIPDFDSADVGTGMCEWADDAGRELVVSLTDAGTVDMLRDGNEAAYDVVAVPGLGDRAWVIDGLLSGTSRNSGRGGTGNDRATVGVVDGTAGLLIAVVDPGGEQVRLATEAAERIVGG